MKIITAILVLASIAIGSPIPDFPFLYVTGRAYEDLPTTHATIRFSIQIESKLSDEGEKRLQNASKAIMTILLEMGVAKSEIDSYEVRKLQTSRARADSKEQDLYFSFSQGFRLKIKDLKLYPKLVERLIGSNEVTDFQSEFSAENRVEAIKRLRKAAFEDARQAAASIAEASGEKLGRIHSASELPYSDLGRLIGEPERGIGGGAAGIQSDVYVVPPTVSEWFQIHVLYRLDHPDSEQGAAGQPPPAPVQK